MRTEDGLTEPGQESKENSHGDKPKERNPWDVFEMCNQKLLQMQKQQSQALMEIRKKQLEFFSTFCGFNKK